MFQTPPPTHTHAVTYTYTYTFLAYFLHAPLSKGYISINNLAISNGKLANCFLLAKMSGFPLAHGYSTYIFGPVTASVLDRASGQDALLVKEACMTPAEECSLTRTEGRNSQVARLQR